MHDDNSQGREDSRNIDLNFLHYSSCEVEGGKGNLVYLQQDADYKLNDSPDRARLDKQEQNPSDLTLPLRKRHLCHQSPMFPTFESHDTCAEKICGELDEETDSDEFLVDGGVFAPLLGVATRESKCIRPDDDISESDSPQRDLP